MSFRKFGLTKYTPMATLSPLAVGVAQRNLPLLNHLLNLACLLSSSIKKNAVRRLVMEGTFSIFESIEAAHATAACIYLIVPTIFHGVF